MISQKKLQIKQIKEKNQGSFFLDEKFELAISGGGKETDRAGKYIIFERELFTPNCRSSHSDKN